MRKQEQSTFIGQAKKINNSAEQSLAFAQKRQRRTVSYFLLTMSAASGLLVAKVVDIVGFEVVIASVGELPGGGSVLIWMSERHLLDVLRNYPKVTAFCLGFTLAIFAERPAAVKLYKRFFLPFDHHLFEAIPANQPYDPLRATPHTGKGSPFIPWIGPLPGRRQGTWQALEEFASPGQPVFDYLLILGRPGIGKTRLVIEFMRLRAEQNGTVSLESHALNKYKRAKPKFAQLISWWKVQVMRMTCGPHDAWDVGWLRAERFDSDPSRTTPVAVDGLTDKISLWRPRRPTLLVLDDPRPGDSRAVLAAFSKGAAHYRQPVRLIIVHQSAPDDLQLDYEPTIDRWTSKVRSFRCQPSILRAKDGFSSKDIRMLRFSMLSLSAAAPIARDEGVKHFLNVTSGNPLLVELGFDWLRAGKPLDDLSVHRLLEERARRIWEAVELAGFSGFEAQHLRECMTVATICGSTVKSTRVNDGTDKASRDFGINLGEEVLADTLLLKQFLPSSNPQLEYRTPMVRPRPIGIAYVRFALERLSESRGKALVLFAWRENPYGTLATSLRLERDSVPSSFDKLAHLLSNPPEKVGLPDTELFQSYAQAACIVDWASYEDKEFSIGLGLESVAANILKRISRQDLQDTCRFVRELYTDSNNCGRRRQDVLISLYYSTLTHTLESAGFETPLALIRELDQFRQCGDGQNRVLCIEDTRLDKAVRFSISAWNLSGDDEKVFYGAAVSAWTSICQEYEHEIIFWPLHVIFAALFDFCERRTLADKPRWSSLGLLVALCKVPECSIVDCQQLAVQVSHATSEPSSTEAAYAQSIAWRAVAVAHVKEPDIVANDWHVRKSTHFIDSIDRLKGIADAFPLDVFIQSQYASALCASVRYHKSDFKKVLDTANYISRIAESFPSNVTLRKSEARAWRIACRFKEKIGLSRLRKLSESFKNDPSIAREYADSLVEASFECLRQEDAELRSRAIRISEQVDRLSARFPDDPLIQFARVEAVRMKAGLFSIINNREGITSAARRASELAAPFQKNIYIQKQVVTAWSFLAGRGRSSFSSQLLAAKNILDIEQRFPYDVYLKGTVIDAWLQVVYRSDGHGPRCEAAAEIVAQAVISNTDSMTIHTEHIRAWGFVAQVYCQNKLKCLEAAEHVSALVRNSLYPNNPKVRLEEARAWRAVAYAHANDSEVRTAAVDHIRTIASLTPDESVLQELNLTLRWLRSLLDGNPTEFWRPAIAPANPGHTTATVVSKSELQEWKAKD